MDNRDPVIAIPTGLVVTRRDGVVRLAWNDNTEHDFGWYRIYRRRMAAYSLPTLIGETWATQFIDPFADAGITYYYSISAVAHGGSHESAPCAAVLVISSPEA